MTKPPPQILSASARKSHPPGPAMAFVSRSCSLLTMFASDPINTLSSCMRSARSRAFGGVTTTTADGRTGGVSVMERRGGPLRQKNMDRTKKYENTGLDRSRIWKACPDMLSRFFDLDSHVPRSGPDLDRIWTKFGIGKKPSGPI